MIQQSAMPADLTVSERLAYQEAYDKRATKYAGEQGVAPVDDAAAFYAEREPILHKSAMAAVARRQRTLGGAS